MDGARARSVAQAAAAPCTRLCRAGRADVERLVGDGPAVVEFLDLQSHPARAADPRLAGANALARAGEADTASLVARTGVAGRRLAGVAFRDLDRDQHRQ